MKISAVMPSASALSVLGLDHGIGVPAALHVFVQTGHPPADAGVYTFADLGRQRADAGLPRQQTLPGQLDRAAQRRNQTQAGDDDAAAHARPPAGAAMGDKNSFMVHSRQHRQL